MRLQLLHLVPRNTPLTGQYLETPRRLSNLKARRKRASLVVKVNFLKNPLRYVILEKAQALCPMIDDNIVINCTISQLWDN